FQGSASAGRDVRDFIRYPRGVDGRDGVSATDDGNRSSVFRYSVGNLERALCKSWNFEDAHRSVPDNGPRSRNLFHKNLDRLRTDVERDHVRGNGFSIVDHLRGGV